MNRQSPTANSQGQGPASPFDRDEKSREEWSPAQGDEDMTNREGGDGEEEEMGDFDEDETNPSPA